MGSGDLRLTEFITDGGSINGECRPFGQLLVATEPLGDTLRITALAQARQPLHSVKDEGTSLFVPKDVNRLGGNWWKGGGRSRGRERQTIK